MSRSRTARAGPHARQQHIAMTAVPYFLEFSIEGSIDRGADACQIEIEFGRPLEPPSSLVKWGVSCSANCLAFPA
jgi:hypothetical protein